MLLNVLKYKNLRLEVCKQARDHKEWKQVEDGSHSLSKNTKNLNHLVYLLLLLSYQTEVNHMSLNKGM